MRLLNAGKAGAAGKSRLFSFTQTLLVSAAILAGAALPFGASRAQTVTAVQDTTCVGVRAGSTTCTAGEFTVSPQFTAAAGTQPFCTAGSTLILDVSLGLSGTNANRYDVGFFAGQNGNDPRAATGMCSAAIFPESPSPWQDFDAQVGDTCGDFLNGGVATPLVQSVKVNCQAATGSDLQIPYVLVYSQNTGPVCDSAGRSGDTTVLTGDVTNASPSKCNAGDATVSVGVGEPPLQVAGYVDVTKQTLPDGDGQAFSFTATGPVGSFLGVSTDGGATITGSGTNTATASLADGATARIYMSVVATDRTLSIVEQSTGQVTHWESSASLNCAAVTGSPTLTTDNATRTITAALNTTNSAAACTFTNTKRARLSLVKNVGGRLVAADQFTVTVSGAGSSTLTDTSGTAIAASTTTVTTSGAGTGNFTNATNPSFRATPGQVLTITDAMAVGSTSALSDYDSRLTCTNAFAGSGATPPGSLPSNSAVTTFDLTPAPDDDITCTFTNAPRPRISLQKAIAASGGRVADTDQFTLSVDAATGTTTGTGNSVTSPAVVLAVTAGNSVALAEIAAGTTQLADYDSSISCSNSNGASATVLPTGAGTSFALTPANNDVISCTLTNARKSATLRVAKAWAPGSIAGNIAHLAATTGLVNNTAALDSTAPTDSNGAFVTVFAGETATLPAETMSPGALSNYDTVVACNAGTLSGSDGQAANTLPITAAMAGTAVTCTYTNTPLLADLSLTKGASSATPIIGTTVTFTLTVSNAGSANATGVVVGDLLPSGYAYVSDNGAGAYVSGTGVWTVGTINAGDSASLEIVATVLPAGSYANTAQVTASGVLDPDSTPNDDAGDDFATNTPVPVAAVIVATDDDFSATPVNGLTGGSTATVFSNDTLNGVAFANGDVTPSITADGGLTGVAITVSGTLTIPANTPAGSYTVTYQICEVANPTNCDSASVSITVTAAAIVAADDDFSATPINGLAGGSTATVFTNDTLNGIAFADAAVTPSVTADGGLTGVAITASGTLTIPANTPAGSYTVTYQICEVLNPSNCDTATVQVTIAAATIVATDDDFSATPINGLAGGSTATVFSNDTLNGVAFADAAVTPSIAADGGLTGVAITASGTLTIPANTPAGSYTVTYQICEVLNPTNCDTASVSITVTAAAIVATDDDFSATPINGLTGGSTATVFSNDTLNGVAFANGDVSPSITANGGLTGVAITASGTLTIPANTPAGSYTVTYQICEVLNPTNCDTATVQVTITAATIVATDDDFSAAPINGLTGGSTASVFSNDTLNGVGFADAAVSPSITADGGLSGVAITASGTLTIPANTPAGSYTVTYQICEVLNPTNCDTATVEVTIAAATIVATDDDFSATPVNGLAGGSTATVFSNDTLNGVAFADAAVSPSISVDGGLTGVAITASGTLTIPANTPAGSYTVTYQICEVLNPSNCDTATVSITVAAATIVATDDDFSATPINGLTGGSTATVFANDTLNGVAFATSDVTPSITADGGLTGVAITATGTSTIPANTPAGSYTVTYQICEVLNPSNCDTATVSITVAAATIVATDDDFSATPINGLAGGSTATVFSNDTLNGVAFADAAVTPSVTADGGLTGVAITASGTLTIPANTPAGSYTVTYQICEVLNPSNCDTATVQVTIAAATIVATDDDFSATPVNGLAGGSTATVFSNDTLNGVAFANGDVSPSITADGGLTGVAITASGTLTIPANTPAGSYTVTYQICEVLNPSNCDTATVQVTIAAATIVATDDDFSATPINGLAGGSTATVFSNDTLNGVAFADAAVSPSITADGGLTGVAITASGTLTIPANTPAGSYTATYQICEVANPTNCDTATVEVTIAAATIVAADDDFSAAPINGLTGGSTATVFTNDTLNGVAFATSDVTPSITADGGLTGVAITASGTLTIPASTPAGSYTVTYQICEVLNPSNCDTATVSITVAAATIVANDDDFSATPVNGLAGGSTATVFSNDTLNGAAFADAAVSPSITADGGLTGVAITASGTLTIPANTPAGSYAVTYQICEVANPTNCDTASVSITVTAAAIVATDDDFSATPINGLTGGSTATVFANDTLNGVAFATSDVTPSITADGGLTGVAITASGTLTIPANTPAGSYTVTYQICEVLNPTNCDSASVSITVAAAAIVATDDDFSATPVNGLAGGSTATVFSNDTLNGVAFANADVTPSITADGGLTGVAITTSGTLTIPANTPAGSYTVTYQICEVLNPSNCDTATVQVTIAAATIVATDDDFSATPINGLAGGSTATVFTNDTLNGVAFADAAVSPSITADGGLTGVAITASGTLTIPASTPAGSYTVTYQICEVANPTNCDSASVSITVTAAAIVAADDDFSAAPIDGLTGGSTATVFTNDTLNGVAFATSDVTPSITADGGLTGLAITASGTLTIPASTPAGSYTVTYQICEVLNPSNCDTATVQVTIAAATLVASDDDFTAAPVNGLTGGSTATVFSNDTLNGVAFASGDVSPSITADGGLTGVAITASGTLTIPANTPAGSYTITYQICEVANPTNCDSASVSITVTAAAIVATDDDFSATPINGLAGGSTATVFTNDTLNGVAFANGDVTPSITADGGLAGVAITASGTLTIPANTPAGSYTITYQICEVANPTNCDSASVSITVAAAAIVAADDDFSATPVNGLAGGSTATVFTNDTLNGIAFADAAVSPSISADGGLTGVAITASGTLTIPASTPAGSYTVTYQICEVLNPANCDTATVSITVVAATIVANDDDFSATPVNGLAGGSTATVFSNDTLNGVAFANGDVTSSITADGGLTGVAITASGTLTIPANTPAGSYTVTYQICEVLNPANCDTATISITVAAATIVATDDDFSATPINGLAGGSTASVFSNDTLNGVAFADAAVTPSITGDGGLTGVAITATGTLTIPANTPAGGYTVSYQICEVLNPSNCDNATVQVTIAAATIVATNDDFSATPIDGLNGGSTATVFSNDTLNGVAFANGDVTPSITADGGLTGVAITASGTLTIPANTAAGSYTVTYQICEVLNPSNCDTATVQVTIAAATIVATDDDFSATPINGLTGGSTATVFTNDTLDGVAFANGDVTPSITADGGLTGVAITASGTLTIPANTPAGSYTVTYQICEALNPSNCDTATVQVTIAAATIVATNDDFSATPIDGLTGGSTATVFTNDTLNGVAFANADVTPSITADGGLTGVAITATGTLTIPANTPAGSYTITYQICEVANPTNCDTATVSIVITVAASPDLSIVKTVSNSTPAVGENVTFTLSASNASAASASAVLVNDLLPAGYAYVSDNGAGAYVSATGVWTIGTLAGGSTVTLDIVVTVLAAGPYANTATIASASSDPTPANNTSTSTPIPVQNPLADLSIEKTSSNLAPQVGSTVTFTISVSNAGPAMATGVTVQDALPAGYTYVSDTGAGAYNNATGVWAIGTLGNGASATLQIVATVLPTGSYANTATVSATTTDPTPGNNSSTSTPVPVALGRLALVKRSHSRDIQAGELVGYTLVVTNIGTEPVTGAVIIDSPPPGLAYVTGSASIDDVDDLVTVTGTGPVAFTGVDVPVGGTATLTYLLRAGAALATGDYVNQATVYANGIALSNTASVSVHAGGGGDALLEQSRVLGKVFDDQDGDGWQDEGERGIPGVRLATVEGLLIETDSQGRYHLEGLRLSDQQRGQNFVIKLDTSTLPAGSVLTTRNPLIRRVTAALPVRFDFGVKLPPTPLRTPSESPPNDAANAEQGQ